MSHAFLPNVGSSRVENIKKRFETNSSSSGSDTFSPRTSPERFVPPSNGRARIASTPPSRGTNNVKRSPAFRCDKIVKGRNVVGNSRLCGERPRSYLDPSPSDLTFKNTNVKRINSTPAKPVDTPPKLSPRFPNPADELSSVFSQRNLKPSGKPTVPSPHPKPEILQKPQIVCTKPERLSPNKSPTTNNNNPNTPQPTKPSTNEPRPAEYAVVDKRKAQTGPNGDTPKPSVRLRPKPSNKPALDHNRNPKTPTTTSEQSPIVASSGTEDPVAESVEDLETPGDDVCRLRLTNTLKKALSSPLPAGPPPRKPPRTFAHVHPSPTTPNGKSVLERIQRLNETTDRASNAKSVLIPHRNDLHGKSNVRPETGPGSYGRTRKPPDNRAANPTRNNANGVRSIRNVFPAARKSTDNLSPSRNDLGPKKQNTDRSVAKPVRSRTESEIMLKKLENVLQKHREAGVVLRGSEGDNGKTSPVRPLPRVPADPNRLFGGCLESLSCAGIDPTYAPTNFYEKLNAKNSEFYVANYTDPVDEPRPTEEHRPAVRRASSAEHIYAEPFEFLHQPRFNGDPVPVLAVAGGRIVEIGHFRDDSEPVPLEDKHRVESDTLHYLCTPIAERATTTTMASGQPGAEGDGPRDSSPCAFPALFRDAAPPETARPLNQDKVIQYLMNQAFSLAALPLDGSDSDTPTTPEDHAPLGPDFTVVHQVAAQSTSGDSEAEKDMSQLTERRKRYVRKVSCLVTPRTSRDYPHLFQYLLLVGLTPHPEKKRGCKPYVKWKYPPDAEVTEHIEEFCFPDASDWPRPSPGEQSYSLVITDERGDRTFGYCRRVLPEGMDVCLPLAYCIISPVRATGFYYKVLSELECRHGQPEILMTAFISELYNSQLPGPGQALKPSFQTVSSAKTGLKHSRTIVRRPLDLRLEERDLTQLFSSLCVPVLMQVFSSLLLERKVVLFSTSLSKLSSCVEALQSILYPFSWQHTFVPVLPSSQLELCDAPTPYIFGVLKDKEGRAPHLSITDGIVVDLDSGQLTTKEGDESSILPTRLKRCLKMALQLVSATTEPGDAARNVLVSEAFIRAFVEVCGHYQQHVVTGPDGRKVFQRDSFVRAVEEPATQQFLEWFSETAMFRAFMDARLAGGPLAGGMFERRASEHSEEVRKNTALFLKNSRVINMKLKSLGDRFKDWTPFT